MHSFYSTRPTQPYDYSYVGEAARAHVSTNRMRVLTIERRKKSLIVAYLLQHPYRSYIVALAVAMALSASAAWAVDFPEPHQQGDVTYVSGGIGSDETDALALVKKDYNLYLTSTDVTGHYLGGSRILISNAAQGVLVDVVAQGPLFYAHLPNGRYHIESFNGTASKKQSVVIGHGKASRVHFSWPVSTADLNISAHNTVEPTIISPDPITIP